MFLENNFQKKKKTKKNSALELTKERFFDD